MFIVIATLEHLPASPLLLELFERLSHFRVDVAIAQHGAAEHER